MRFDLPRVESDCGGADAPDDPLQAISPSQRGNEFKRVFQIRSKQLSPYNVDLVMQPVKDATIITAKLLWDIIHRQTKIEAINQGF